MFDTKVFDTLVEERIAHTADERKETRKHIALGKGLAAEKDTKRRVDFARHIIAPSSLVDLSGAELIQGNSIDYVDANFLPRGASKARAVAMVLSRDDRSPMGTGFMISPELFITNNHVLLDAAAAEDACLAFDYELGPDGQRLPPTYFRLDPHRFFLSDPWQKLDFTIVAVGERMDGGGELATFGCCKLSDRDDKEAKGAAVNLVEHPNGALKKVVLRENHIVARGEFTLHYEADTEPGSSGSLVCNDAWEPVALHHWGKPRLETRTADGVEIPIAVNEGIRISAIVAKLRAYLARERNPDKRALLEAALVLQAPVLPISTDLRESTPQPKQKKRSTEVEPKQPSTTTATIVLPLEITFRVLSGGASAGVISSRDAMLPKEEGAAERIQLDLNYGNRRGYDPAFLPGFKVPFPKVPSGVSVAPLNADQPDAKRGELKYEHFSVVMNKKRRVALFTATNIDGATYIEIDRDTGLPVEAEAAEKWFDDPRMSPEFYLGQSCYSANSTYFDRGHLTRRSDPTWGTKQRAVRANADTFHRANGTPQHWRFNQSTRFWQGVERYYLEFGATLDHSRLSVFQGPVCDDADPIYTDEDGVEFQVPLQFWKLVVRVTNGELKATALLVSQAEIIDEPRKGMHPGGDEEAPDVSQFLCPVEKVERLTGLGFGGLHNHDTFERSGEEGAEAADMRPIRAWSDLA